MRFTLYRPLNAFVISIQTDIGDRYFLLDTGCPISFAHRAQTLPIGAWFMDEVLILKPQPFSLVPISERLGLPIEGFIGLRDFLKHKYAHFNFDENILSLGESAIEAASILDQLDTESNETFEVTSAHGLPLGLITSLDDQYVENRSSLPFFIDTGSRFIMTRDEKPPARVELDLPLYSLDILTPMGNLRTVVSTGHRAHHNSLTTGPLAVATGSPATFPMILGTEWLSTFNAYFNFAEKRLNLMMRNQEFRPTWACLTSDIYAPMMEFIFDPNDYDQSNRTFSVMPRASAQLPDGIWPMTRYRLKGLDISAGPNGVNEFISKVMITSEEGLKSVVFINDLQEEINVPLVPLFQ
jgi:hypothetical protein